MRHIDTHIIHCSDSTFGDAAMIRYWHLERGWSDIGYHFVILPDGSIEIGRPIEKVGAHCKGMNSHSVGTCLIGKDDFTQDQFNSLRALHRMLERKYPAIKAFGHSDFNAGKTCPNFEVKTIL